MPRRLLIVSGHAGGAFTPRGERTRALAEGLGEDWDVEVVGPPAPPGGEAGDGRGRLPASARAAARRVVEATLYDKWEPWSARTVGRRWTPRADLALLIAFPFSPAVYAARALRRASIPYVVDAGDPWVLTTSAPENRHLARRRALRAERELWAGAAGAILTTHQQATALRSHFSGLPLLVRPNGYPTVDGPVAARAGATPGQLRLAHFGMLSSARISVAPLLAELAASGRFGQVAFEQYGDDFAGMLADAPAGVDVHRHPSVPWGEVVGVAAEASAVLVVGNHSGTQLPSKAMQYLTLPAPRIAWTNDLPDDALAEFAGRMPGWLVLRQGEADAAERVAEHVTRAWSDAELQPPESESWPVVSREVSAFLEGCM